MSINAELSKEFAKAKVHKMRQAECGKRYSGNCIHTPSKDYCFQK